MENLRPMWLTLLFMMAASFAAIAAQAAPSLKTIMQNPDWIGPPVEAAWWQLDGSGYHYRVKREGSDASDIWAMPLSGDAATVVKADRLVTGDGPMPAVHRASEQAVSVVNGSLFLRNLATGSSRLLFSGGATVADAMFSPDGDAVFFKSGSRWWRVPTRGASAAVPLTDLRFEDDPSEAPEGALEADQLRLFATLERERLWDVDAQAQRVERAAAPALGPAPWYLGKGKERVDSALSPDGRWLLLVVRDAGNSRGKRDQMPHYVSRSGYVDIEDVRPLVGRNAPAPQALWLLDLQTRTRHQLAMGDLSGIDEDPLLSLKQAQDLPVNDADNPRPVTFDRIEWHPDGGIALIQAHSIDNKDRWIVKLDAASQSQSELHRLTDPAWVNWQFNDMGWVPGSDAAWFLSEESGYSHLYTANDAGITQVTRGEFEVSAVEFTADGRSAILITNRNHPTEYDLYELLLPGGDLDQLTELRGVESFALHPDGTRVLVRYSSAYRPAQAGVVDLASRQLVAQTNTLNADYLALEWQQPQYVPVPSQHGVEKPIWSKFYPARGDHEGPRPAVLFVHGAGYTQNTHHKFPYYFREQMFHNVLTDLGYHVLDMDYRASRGYGRDWRTAIYRQMGTPELEDLIDGVAWLVKEHNVDPSRVGVYGGSYGGFMTFMAMFKAPDVFTAGASLRPVTDWRHYNHPYTANILNTPEVDPEAHRRSSPIEFVEGFEGHLLISHGMLDDNVFYKDSVRLVQRLIELEKENWELASYPLEPHGYVHPESWLDQYRRIFKLFETTIGD